jgi:hypothetical protein
MKHNSKIQANALNRAMASYNGVMSTKNITRGVVHGR